MLDMVIRNGILVTDETNYLPQRGSIGIKDGRIARISLAPAEPPEGTVILDAEDKIVLPGLINGHCHGDMTLLRGLLDDLTLREQNLVMGKSRWLRDYLTPRHRLLSRQLTYLEAIKSGTTFITENMYWGLGLDAVRVMKETGIQGALVLGVRASFDVQNQYLPLEELRAFGNCAEENGLLPILGTVAEEDFSPGALTEIANIAEQLNWLTTQHLAENPWRQELMRERFGTTSIRYLARHGFLHGRMIGSHAVCADDEEIRLLKQAGVRVVNTPLCEAKIADGLAPVPQYLKAGIPVGLGTDGALWNNSNDIFREMKGICLLHTLSSGVRTLSHREALRMATLGGAAVFGLDHITGSIRVGKRADLILVDTRSAHMRPLRLGSHENVSSSLVYNATGADVSDSIIGGRLVMRDRTVLTMNEAALLEQAQRASEEILSRCLKDGVLPEDHMAALLKQAEEQPEGRPLSG